MTTLPTLYITRKLDYGHLWGKMKTLVHFQHSRVTTFLHLNICQQVPLITRVQFEHSGVVASPHLNIQGWAPLHFHFFIMVNTKFSFQLTLEKVETQTFWGGPLIGNFLCDKFAQIESDFFHVFITANANFLFPSTLKKNGNPNFGGRASC